MAITVDVPLYGTSVDFPNGTSSDTIKSVLAKYFPYKDSDASPSNDFNWEQRPAPTVDFASQGRTPKGLIEQARERQQMQEVAPVDMAPAGYGADPLTQDFQNTASSPRRPVPTQIVKAEKADVDLSSALDRTNGAVGKKLQTSDYLEDASRGYLSEAPDPETDADRMRKAAEAEGDTFEKSLGESLTRTLFGAASGLTDVARGAYRVSQTLASDEDNAGMVNPLSQDPIYKALTDASFATSWLKDGIDRSTGKYIGSPFSITPEERERRPTASFAQDTMEGMASFVAKLYMSGGSSLALGLSVAAEDLASNADKYKVLHPDASDLAVTGAATPGALVSGATMVAMPYITKPLAGAIASKLPVNGLVSNVLADVPVFTAQGVASGLTNKAAGVTPEYKASEAASAQNVIANFAQATVFAVFHGISGRTQPVKMYDVPAGAEQFDDLFHMFLAATGAKPEGGVETAKLQDEMIRAFKHSAMTAAVGKDGEPLPGQVNLDGEVIGLTPDGLPSVGQVDDVIDSLRKLASIRRAFKEKQDAANRAAISQDEAIQTESQNSEPDVPAPVAPEVEPEIPVSAPTPTVGETPAESDAVSASRSRLEAMRSKRTGGLPPEVDNFGIGVQVAPEAVPDSIESAISTAESITNSVTLESVNHTIAINAPVDPLGLDVTPEEGLAAHQSSQALSQHTLDTEYYPAKLDLESRVSQAASAIAGMEQERNNWASRKYQQNTHSVEVGDEISGTTMSVGSINEGRRSKVIKSLNFQIMQKREEISSLKKQISSLDSQYSHELKHVATPYQHFGTQDLLDHFTGEKTSKEGAESNGLQILREETRTSENLPPVREETGLTEGGDPNGEVRQKEEKIGSPVTSEPEVTYLHVSHNGKGFETLSLKGKVSDAISHYQERVQTLKDLMDCVGKA